MRKRKTAFGSGITRAMYAHLLFPLVWLGATIPLYSQTADTIFAEAGKAFELKNFDEAYRGYEQAGEAYLIEKQLVSYLKCRIEMARCSQFTSMVSRQAMGDIIAPAIDLIKQQDDLKSEVEAAECYQFMARYQWSIAGDYPSAIGSYQISLSIAEAIGDSARYYKMATLSDLSHVYSNQEKFDQALNYARQALELSAAIYGKDHVENGPRYYSLGFAYYRKGYFDDAIRAIRKGIQLLETNDGPEMQIGLGYHNLSAVYVSKLDQEGAKQSALIAEKILSKYLGPEHEALATIYWDLGSMYTDLEEYELAEENLMKAIEIFRSKFGDAYPQLPQLFHQLGFCYDQIRDYQKAEKWHEEGYRLNNNSFGIGHPRTGESFRQLARHYLEKKELEKAEIAIGNGLATISAPENQSYILKAGLYEVRAKLAEIKKEWNDAASAYDLAIAAICNPDKNQDEYTIDDSFNPLYFTQFNSEKAKVLFQIYQSEQNSIYLQEAIATARKAHNGIRRLRNSYQGEESKLFLQKRAREHYDLMMEILYEEWQNKKDENYLAEAWQISEQSKSLLLFEEIKTTTMSFSGVPDKLLDSLRNLRQDLNYQRQEISDLLTNGDSFNLSAKQLEFVRTQNNVDFLEKSMDEKYPQFNSLRRELSPVQIREIANFLPPQSILIEYYQADSSLYIFTVGSEIGWSKIKLPDNFLDLLAQYRQECSQLEQIVQHPQKSIDSYNRLSRELLNLVLPSPVLPSDQRIKNVIFVPDQELGYISFESLYTPANSYLLEDFAISYAFSASLYALESRQANRWSLQSFAGFAPTYASDTTNYRNDLAVNNLFREGRYNLPGARDEVKQISQLLDGQVWIGEEATESTFKQEASKHGLIHLSLHGIIEEDDPMRSRLLFYRENSNENGALNAYEIYGLNLKANLLVLSACNTAAGSLQSGEGILSLSRAFAFAGIPNLIASLWRADDDATSDIMVRFYQGLKKGLTKAEALRSAKLEYLSDQKSLTYKHPYFWSSFILVGENASAFSSDTQSRWLVAIILLVVFTAFMYARLKKKKIPV